MTRFNLSLLPFNPKPLFIFWLAPVYGFLYTNTLSAIELEVPIDCDMGKKCFIQNYVDMETGHDWSDLHCGKLTYDKHKGTDFRLRNLADMQAGVDVIASASGRVKGVRNNMPDIDKRKADPESYKGKECGNGVVIDHGDGWETQYCHMMEGSIVVTEGQLIETGRKIGKVGLSGDTVFPHIHLSVRHHGRHLDPFTGHAVETGCGADTAKNLWSAKALERLPYISTALLNMGIVDQAPSAEAVRDKNYQDADITKDSEFIIAWLDIMGIRKGDKLQLTITRPGGQKQVFDEVLQKPKALYFYYAGLKLHGKSGLYKITARLTRPMEEDAVLFQRNKEVEVK